MNTNAFPFPTHDEPLTEAHRDETTANGYRAQLTIGVGSSPDFGIFSHVCVTLYREGRLYAQWLYETDYSEANRLMDDLVSGEHPYG
jgi:hypothetical protein